MYIYGILFTITENICHFSKYCIFLSFATLCQLAYSYVQQDPTDRWLCFGSSLWIAFTTLIAIRFYLLLLKVHNEQILQNKKNNEAMIANVKHHDLCGNEKPKGAEVLIKLFEK